MGSYIHAAQVCFFNSYYSSFFLINLCLIQTSIRSIVKDISELEKCSVRFGLVCYRDHPPQDNTYVVKTFNFTDDMNEMQKNVNTMQADGGYDKKNELIIKL